MQEVSACVELYLYNGTEGLIIIYMCISREVRRGERCRAAPTHADLPQSHKNQERSQSLQQNARTKYCLSENGGVHSGAICI